MKINLCKYFLSMAASCILCGCFSTQPIDHRQVLGLQEGAKLYTLYNIWYEDPELVPSINYHKGKIIPFGTEVSIESVDSEFVNMRTVADGKLFKLDYPKRWRPKDGKMEEYLKSTFTTKNAGEQSAGITPDRLAKIKQGIIEKGMTKSDVIKAYGLPPGHRTPDEYKTSLIYIIQPNKSVRVIFKNDVVNHIIE